MNRRERPQLPTFPQEDLSWQDRAACRSSDVDVFFPIRGGQKRAALAKAICAGCGVQPECLDYAVRCGFQFGVFGGATPTERREIRVGTAVRAERPNT